MRTLAALSFAAAVTMGSMTSASAFVHPWIDMQGVSVEQVQPSVEATHYDRCHGRGSGTAHHTCGTRTGGPSGGLF